MIVVVLAVLVILVFSLRTIASIYTDSLWYSSISSVSTNEHQVFSTMLETKVGLFLTFGLLFFLAMWGNLLLCNRLGPSELFLDAPEDELVRRFQGAVRPYAGRLYALLAFVFALIAASSAIGQWQNFLLFTHSKNFGMRDPLFHNDYSLYIFRLPFITFAVDWFLASLFAIILVSVVFHYLNGGIRAARVSPRVSPAVKVHLSVLIALLAIAKAAGYLVARWHMVTSMTNGVFEGAGYTDVHARMPAMTILFYLSLAAAVILLVNVRSRGWSLPAVAVGLWVFVALVIGVLYPTLLQALKVSPAQISLEAPYIARNITATRQAFALDKVVQHNFVGAQTISSADVKADKGTLANIRLWDPSPQIALETTLRRQSIRSYYTFTTLAVDRYKIKGKITPVLIGSRQLNSASLPSPSWVNIHLQYTHGIGVAAIAANTAVAGTGNPVYDVSDVPPLSTNGMPQLKYPDIYFGINQSGWVVANTKQAELDYQVDSGANAGQPVESHYKSTGGVAVGGIFSRAALALRLGNFNFLISSQITPKSRVLFVRDVQQMAEKAAPFLTFNSQPYPVIANGSVQYVLDGFTTTSQYPYSENAGNLNVDEGGLPANFNYVRNSVKVVINAYTGSMKFYDVDPSDPILQVYRAAFPKMFLPLSAMPKAIRTHLRYPSDLLSVQAATYGAYHITSSNSFYSASDKWEISPSTGAGTPSQALAENVRTDNAGNVVSTQLAPMSPVFQVGALPETKKQQLLETISYVPSGNSGTVQGLTAFIEATSNPNNYGKLNLYVTPRGTSVTGPAQADSEMEQNSTVSSTISLLDQHGSEVLLGNNLMVPLDQSVLYIRPLYITSTTNSLPQLKYVIAVFNQDVDISPTLAGALTSVLGANVSVGPPGSSTGGTTPPSGGTTPSGKTAQDYLKQAAADYTAAQTALTNGDLGTYQDDVKAMDQQLQLAQNALKSK